MRCIALGERSHAVQGAGQEACRRIREGIPNSPARRECIVQLCEADAVRRRAGSELPKLAAQLRQLGAQVPLRRREQLLPLREETPRTGTRPAVHARKIVALSEIPGPPKTWLVIQDALKSQSFSCECIAALLGQRKRPLPRAGPLHVNRRENLLEPELPEPDLAAYDTPCQRDGSANPNAAGRGAPPTAGPTPFHLPLAAAPGRSPQRGMLEPPDALSTHACSALPTCPIHRQTGRSTAFPRRR